MGTQHKEVALSDWMSQQVVSRDSIAKELS